MKQQSMYFAAYTVLDLRTFFTASRTSHKNPNDAIKIHAPSLSAQTKTFVAKYPKKRNGLCASSTKLSQTDEKTMSTDENLLTFLQVDDNI